MKYLENSGVFLSFFRFKLEADFVYAEKLLHVSQSLFKRCGRMR